MTKNINEHKKREVAYKMFEYDYTELGWDVEWCILAWNDIADIKTKYIKFAEIAIKPIEGEKEVDVEEIKQQPLSYEVMDAKMETLRSEKQGPFWEGVEWAEEQHGIFGDRK